MGAWGHRSFENDDALDWLGDLVESANAAHIESTLDCAANAQGYLDAATSSCALAAAELVAAELGSPADDLPPESREWISENAIDAEALRPLAKQAVMRVLNDSELAGLWRDSEDGESWSEHMHSLASRLGQTTEPSRGRSFGTCKAGVSARVIREYIAAPLGIGLIALLTLVVVMLLVYWAGSAGLFD